MTGIVRLEFDYDDNNLLTTITDTFDVATNITRDGEGQATDITGPFGHNTELGYNAEGALQTVSAVIDEDSDRVREVRFDYDPETGLLNLSQGGVGDTTTYEFDDLGRIDAVTDALGVVEKYTGSGALAAFSVGVQTGNATGQDEYGRSHVAVDLNLGSSGNLYDAFSFSDRDSQALTSSEFLDRSFAATLPGGATVSGVTTASEQWGEQVRIPSTTTLTTPQGRTVTQSLDISVSGLALTAMGVVANPLDFDTFQTTIEVNGAQYRQTFDRSAKTLTRVSPEERATVTRSPLYLTRCPMYLTAIPPVSDGDARGI